MLINASRPLERHLTCASLSSGPKPWRTMTRGSGKYYCLFDLKSWKTTLDGRYKPQNSGSWQDYVDEIFSEDLANEVGLSAGPPLTEHRTMERALVHGGACLYFCLTADSECCQMCVACSMAICQSMNPTHDETTIVAQRYRGGSSDECGYTLRSGRLMPIGSMVGKDVWPSDCEDYKLLPVSEFMSASLPLHANVSLM